MKRQETLEHTMGSDRTSWWREARFGMFIHWGLYAIPGRGEWVMHEEAVKISEYEKLADIFNPVKYDPRAWARLARQAGMRYMVLTTKHHDGFCLFDTKLTPFNSVRCTARRDLVREYVDACRAEGLAVGFYYSIKDWHHPNCPLDDGDRLRLLEPGARQPDAGKYLAFMKGQLTELLTQYGKVDILWFDGGLEAMNPFGPELARYIRSLQPAILINNRLGQDEDFKTPEQEIPLTPLLDSQGQPLYWETCDTLTGWYWAYCRYNRHMFRPTAHLLRRLVTAASSGGNYLLNVGPRADGTIQPEAALRLRAMGQWLRRYGESIYATEEGPACHPPYGRMTCKGSRVFLHVFDWPKDSRLALPSLTGRLLSARMLGGPTIPLNRQFLSLPEQALDAAASVIVLDYAETPSCAAPRKTIGLSGPASLPPVGYHVARGQPVAFCDRGRLSSCDKHHAEAFWSDIRPLRFTPEGHYDHAAEQFSGVPRDNRFACTMRAMHAGEVLYLFIEIETDRLYLRPDLDLIHNDGVKCFFAAGRHCARNTYNPEAFELTVEASGRTWMPNEALYPGTVFRHEVYLTPKGYVVQVALPFRMMRKKLDDPDSYLRPGDKFRFNLLAVQAAPFAKIKASPKNAQWWEAPRDPRDIQLGARHWMYWKGQAHEEPFDNVTVWDVWKIED